jgi:hypothetical protein
MRVKSYRDVLDEYRVHPEAKSVEDDGKPCARETMWLLSRRAIRAAGVLYISKEAKRIDDVTAGLVHDPKEVQDVYADPAHDPWNEYWRGKLKTIPSSVLAAHARVSERSDSEHSQWAQTARSGNRRASARCRDEIRERRHSSPD